MRLPAPPWPFSVEQPGLTGESVETIGYVGRALSAAEAPAFSKNPFIIQSTLLLLGPALYAASMYMILGRLIRLLDAGAYALIPPRWLTKFFVLGDVLSFCTQGGGAFFSSLPPPPTVVHAR